MYNIEILAQRIEELTSVHERNLKRTNDILKLVKKNNDTYDKYIKRLEEQIKTLEITLNKVTKNTSGIIKIIRYYVDETHELDMMEELDNIEEIIPENLGMQRTGEFQTETR